MWDALSGLPEHGKELIRTVERYLKAGSLELVEKALLALMALAETRWGKAHMQVLPLFIRLHSC